MTAENERPPPLHSRVLTTLRETFFPAAFIDWLRGGTGLPGDIDSISFEWETEEERAAYYAAHPESHAARRTEQRRILREWRESNYAMPMGELTRRYWHAGKPPRPTPPTNE